MVRSADRTETPPPPLHHHQYNTTHFTLYSNLSSRNQYQCKHYQRLALDHNNISVIMFGQTLLWMTLLVVVVATAAAPSDKKCAEADNVCKDTSDCCAGCCKNNKCVLTSDCTAAAADPCYLHACPSGKVCYLATVECLQSPCLPIPACKVDDSDYD